MKHKSPNKENSMENVVQLPVMTRLDLDADKTLERLAGKLDGFVLAGYDKDGNEFFSSTYADGGAVLWLLKRCEMSLLSTVDEREGDT